MDEIDEKIDEIFDNICKNEGYNFENNDSWKYYNHNQNIFRILIEEYKLMSVRNRDNKLPLTSKGYKVCKCGGFVKWKRKQKIVKTFKIIGGTILVIAALTTTYVNVFPTKEADPFPNTQIPPDQQQHPTKIEQDSLTNETRDSINIFQTDSIN